MKESMENDIERICENDDEVVGYVIVATRKSGGVSCAIKGSTSALVGALEISKYKIVSSMKGGE